MKRYILKQTGQGVGRTEAAMALAKSGVPMTVLCPNEAEANRWKAMDLPNVTLIFGWPVKAEKCENVWTDEQPKEAAE